MHARRPHRSSLCTYQRMEFFLYKETQASEHTHSAVCDLAFPIAVDLELRLALQEVVGIEASFAATNNVEVARKAVRKGASAGRLGLELLGRHRLLDGRLLDRRLLSWRDLLGRHCLLDWRLLRWHRLLGGLWHYLRRSAEHRD